MRIVPTDLYTVELIRGPNGFGFSLRGGAEYDGSSLAVSDVQKFGPAHEGGVTPGDEILGINGVSTQDMARAWALNLIGQYPVVKLFMRKNIKTPAEQQGMIQQSLYSPTYEQYPPQSNPYQMFPSQANGQIAVMQPQQIPQQQQQAIYGTEDDMQFFSNERQRAQL